jgi:hypothetical protein
MIPTLEKNVTNEYKIYQIVIKCPKFPLNIPNGHKIYKHLPILQNLPKLGFLV